MRRILLFALLLPLLASQPPPRLTVLDYYRRLPYGALPDLDEPPSVVDAANGYLRLGPAPTPRHPRFAEVAVWRTPDGAALIGTNYQTPPGGPGCGDETCHARVQFFRYRVVDATETRAQTLNAPSKNWRPADEVYFTVPPAVGRAVQQRLRQLGLPQPQPWDGTGPTCVTYFPRRGTSIRVALYTGPIPDLDRHDREISTYQVAPPHRNQDLTLCWLRWQQGRFVAATQP